MSENDSFPPPPNGTDNGFISPGPGADVASPLAGNVRSTAPISAERLRPDEYVISGNNPLVAAANPLLNLIPQIRTTIHHDNPESLRTQLIDEVRLFERRAQQAGIPNETIIGARYCLCTALDEAAALTPWGGANVWTRQGLLVTFHKETFGGEKFFKLLAKLSQGARAHIDLLEMLYFCLMLGFEGQYRVMDNGRSQLETLKQRLLGILRDTRGEYDKELSPHWKDPLSQTPVRRMWLPLWACAAIMALLIGLLYMILGWSLGGRSDQTFGLISELHLPPMPATATPVRPVTLDRLSRFLEPEIREGLVSVRDEADRSIVIIRGDGLFESGSATIKDRYISVISRVADAMNQVNGNILVSGYTDNVPIRGVRFQSNWHLSQERADSVKRMLELRLTQAHRVRAEGRGEADPVAPNDSPANKALNRRVEITLLVAPTVTHSEVNQNKGAQ